MDDLEYLFPKALRVTPSGISRILMLGSCQTAQIHYFLSQAHPAIEFQYILSNYVGDLPSINSDKYYEMAFIQFPLRSIITDHIVWFDRLTDSAFCDKIIDTAKETLAAMYEAAVEYASGVSGLILVSNFILPQRDVASSLHARGTKADLREIVGTANAYLRELVSKDENCLLIDTDSIASMVGKRYILDDDVSFFGHNALKSRLGRRWSRPASLFDRYHPSPSFILPRRKCSPSCCSSRWINFFA